MNTKKLSFIQRNNERHWVGDGFPVRSVFSYNELAQELSPFLLLDYAGPEEFPPANPATEHRRGVGAHPHRGFETVTIVYDGEVEHRDSTGAGGRIGPGDVQWMTAASGIVHEEYHGENYAKTGGPFEMVQLWVNLPAKDKMSPPGYQNIENRDTPRVALPEEAGHVRVIAGEYGSAKGPARTFSPIDVWDVRLRGGARTTLPTADGHTTSFLVLQGRVKLAQGETLGHAELAVFETEGRGIEIEALEDTKLLYLGGKPLGEPVVGYGPFVMNTDEEIRQAFVDYRSGKMGRL